MGISGSDLCCKDVHEEPKLRPFTITFIKKLYRIKSNPKLISTNPHRRFFKAFIAVDEMGWQTPN